MIDRLNESRFRPPLKPTKKISRLIPLIALMSAACILSADSPPPSQTVDFSGCVIGKEFTPPRDLTQIQVVPEFLQAFFPKRDPVPAVLKLTSALGGLGRRILRATGLEAEGLNSQFEVEDEIRINLTAQGNSRKLGDTLAMYLGWSNWKLGDRGLHDKERKVVTVSTSAQVTKKGGCSPSSSA